MCRRSFGLLRLFAGTYIERVLLCGTVLVWHLLAVEVTRRWGTEGVTAVSVNGQGGLDERSTSAIVSKSPFLMGIVFRGPNAQRTDSQFGIQHTHRDPTVRFLDDIVQEEYHPPSQPRFLVQFGFVDEPVSHIQNFPFSIFLGSHSCSLDTQQFPVPTVTSH